MLPVDGFGVDKVSALRYALASNLTELEYRFRTRHCP